MKIGDRLPNGATCVDTFVGGDRRVVLAKWDDQYVTWRCDESWNCYWGHYHSQLIPAVRDYNDRCRMVSSLIQERRTP
jgi:hypothetical protein